MSNRISYNSIPQNGLVLDMPLNGNANARVGSNGIATNLVYLDSEKGYTSKVGSFNGVSSEIVGTHTLGTGDITFSYTGYLYLYGTQTQIRGEFLAIGDLNLLNTGLTFSIRPKAGGNDAIYFDYAANAGGVTVARVNYGAWNYITITKTGSTIVIGINGIEETFTKTGLNVTTNALRIGRYNSTVTNAWFNGKIGLIKICNRVLSTEEIHNLKLEGDRLFGDKPNYPQLLRGLKAYYDFKGGSLSNLVDGTNATNNGAVVTTDHLGRSGNAYSFNGSSSYINTPNGPYNFGTGNFTISMIVKRNTAGTVQTILSNLTASSVTGIAIYFSALNQLIFETWSGGVNHIIQSSSTFSSLSTNYHIVCIKNGASLFSYIDGVLLTGITFGGGNLNISNAVIGAFGKYTFNNSGFWNGTISQLIIQNQALNASEVKELYNLISKEYIYPFSKSSILSLQKGLVMHLDSNGVDLSGNGNNGTLTAVTPTRRGQSEGGIYNGSSSYMQTSSIILGIANNFSCFTNISTTNITNSVFLQGYNYPTDALNTFKITLENSKFVIYLVNSSGITFKYYITTSNFSINTNYLVGFTWDGINLKIYVNGVKQTTTKITDNVGVMTDTARKIFIGSNVGVNNFFNGNIYSPKIRNRALTPKEVEMEYYLNYIN